jgi:hypothetical protein
MLTKTPLGVIKNKRNKTRLKDLKLKDKTYVKSSSYDSSAYIENSNLSAKI